MSHVSDKEKRMVEAHKAGVATFKVFGVVPDMASVIRQSRKLYLYEHQREAFIAGYLGEQRRQKEGRGA